jgi:hypothetical protein
VLFAKVVLAPLLDRPAKGYLDIQRAAHLRRTLEFTQLEQQGTLVDTLCAGRGLNDLEADLLWIDQPTACPGLVAGAVRP